MFTALLCASCCLQMGNYTEGKFWIETSLLISRKSYVFVSKLDEELISLAKLYSNRKNIKLLPLDIIYFTK